MGPRCYQLPSRRWPSWRPACGSSAATARWPPMPRWCWRSPPCQWLAGRAPGDSDNRRPCCSCCRPAKIARLRHAGRATCRTPSRRSPRESARLIEVLRRKSPQQIAELMDISDPLAALNVARYQAWSPRVHRRNAEPGRAGLRRRRLRRPAGAQTLRAGRPGLGPAAPAHPERPVRRAAAAGPDAALPAGDGHGAGRSARRRNLYQFWGSASPST